MQLANTLVPVRDPSIAAAPDLGRVRVGYFWGLDKLVSQLGGSPAEVLESQSLNSQIFSDPDNTIECSAAISLLEYCSTSLNDPLFGLHLAAQQRPEAFGCVMALAQSAPTLRQAIQCLVDFIPVSASPECELEIVAMAKVVELRWRSNIGFGDEIQTYYHGLLLMLKSLQALGSQSFRPSYAQLRCPVERANYGPLYQHLGCRVRGGAEYNAIAFPVELLDQPLETSNRLMYNILGDGLAQLRNNSRGDFVEQVSAAVRRGLSAGVCSVDVCADDLHTSTRTLQKRLKRMNIKFSDIVLDERIKLAKQALLWSDYTLDEIAFQLGYSEQTSFGRAFKRATGVTPKSFRLQARSGAKTEH